MSTMKTGKPTRVRSVIATANKRSASARMAVEQKQLERLTQRFFSLQEQLARDAVETMREMGKILQAGKKLLGGGGYSRWVQDDLGVSVQAARNYRRVTELGESSPGLFVKWKELGASKIIRLSRIDPKKRAEVLRKKSGRKSVTEMTDADFAAVTRSYLKPRRKVTGNMRAHGMRMKLVAVLASLRAGLSFPPIENQELRRALSADLDQLVRAARALQRHIR